MKKVLVCGAIVEEGVARLRARDDVAFEIIEEVKPPPERLKAAIADAHALVLRTAPCGRDVIEAAQQLRVVSRHGVGFDNVDVEACRARGIAVAISANANATTVAEHALALILALAKKIPHYDRAVRADDWEARGALDLVDLAGRTLLLVGCGRIGAALAARARAFAMSVLIFDPYLDDAKARAIGAEKVETLEKGLARADVVSLHAPKTPETRNIIDARALASMKPAAFLINTARGGLIDEAALANALRSGALAGAGIDVFEREPPPADHPLMGLDRAILSPHLGGVTKEAMVRMAIESVDNALAALDGALDPAVRVDRR